MPNSRTNRPNQGVSGFDSLTLALEGQFERSLGDLPDALRKRVRKEFFLVPWDALYADQRRDYALQLDYQHDPATQNEQKFWWEFSVRKGALEKQIAEWEAVGANSAGELSRKEERLAELRQRLAWMRRQERYGRRDYFPGKVRQPNRKARATPDSVWGYVAYPVALQRLSTRLGGVTPEELAAWVYAGPSERGGLSAYLNANELQPPPVFRYSYLGPEQSPDYLEPLMACWFWEDEIAEFDPADRYMTGKELIERWSRRPGIRAEAFIRAKMAESRLLGMHPIYGGTQGMLPNDSELPPIETGLFLRSQIDEIEASDFANEADATLDRKSSQSKEPRTGSVNWFARNAQAAANIRHDKPGGSRDKQAKIRAIWASGKYDSRDLCAEQECAALQMSISAARRALIGTPDPERT